MPRKREAGKGEPAGMQGFSEAPQACFEADFARKPGLGLENRVRLTLGPGGRVVIPAALREAMEIEEGDAILAWAEDGELHMVSPRVGARQARSLLKSLLPEGGSLVDELIAERRAEARAEHGG